MKFSLVPSSFYFADVVPGLVVCVRLLFDVVCREFIVNCLYVGRIVVFVFILFQVTVKELFSFLLSTLIQLSEAETVFKELWVIYCNLASST